MAGSLKPLPRPTWDSAPFWDACLRHSLELQRCVACGKFWFPPSNRCAHCLSDSWDWRPVAGRGTLVTFTVMRRAYHPGFEDELPYTVAVVELTEGPRLITNLVGCQPQEARVGLPVTVLFEDLSPEATLPVFRPA